MIEENPQRIHYLAFQHRNVKTERKADDKIKPIISCY
jgi:hypothetical protein